MRWLGAIALLLLGIAASSFDSPANSAEARSRSSHLVVIVMENKEYDDVIGSANAPYINGLARKYALATNFFGVRHPSLPNYFAMTGGQTFGIDSDCTSCHVAGRSIVDELESASISWKAYMQDMPTSCYQGSSSGSYVKKHNPFVYYDRIAGNKRRCAKVVPYRRLGRDLRKHRLPKLVWITPNVCNDMHDCSVRTGDTYLSRVVPSLLRALGRHGFLILTWDEGSSSRGCCNGSRGGQIATIVAGPDVRGGARVSVPLDHYSTLRTVSEALGVPPLGQAACQCTNPLDPLFVRRPKI